jgi:hypothetical protein
MSIGKRIAGGAIELPSGLVIYSKGLSRTPTIALERRTASERTATANPIENSECYSRATETQDLGASGLSKSHVLTNFDSSSPERVHFLLGEGAANENKSFLA